MQANEIKQFIAGLPDWEFKEIQDWIPSEIDRRYENSLEEKGAQEAIKALRDKGLLPTPATININDVQAGDELTNVDEWKNPNGDKSLMFATGDIVSHGGKLWVSMLKGLNNWEPGAEGIQEFVWKEVPTIPKPTPPKQPPAEGGEPEEIPTPDNSWTPNKNYQLGELITYGDKTYKVQEAHKSNETSTPDKTPELYKLT